MKQKPRARERGQDTSVSGVWFRAARRGGGLGGFLGGRLRRPKPMAWNSAAVSVSRCVAYCTSANRAEMKRCSLARPA